MCDYYSLCGVSGPGEEAWRYRPRVSNARRLARGTPPRHGVELQIERHRARGKKEGSSKGVVPRRTGRRKSSSRKPAGILHTREPPTRADPCARLCIRGSHPLRRFLREPLVALPLAYRYGYDIRHTRQTTNGYSIETTSRPFLRETLLTP